MDRFGTTMALSFASLPPLTFHAVGVALAGIGSLPVVTKGVIPLSPPGNCNMVLTCREGGSQVSQSVLSLIVNEIAGNGLSKIDYPIPDGWPSPNQFRYLLHRFPSSDQMTCIPSRLTYFLGHRWSCCRVVSGPRGW